MYYIWRYYQLLWRLSCLPPMIANTTNNISRIGDIYERNPRIMEKCVASPTKLADGEELLVHPLQTVDLDKVQ